MKFRIAPEDAAFVLRCVVVRSFIEHFGRFTQHAKAMRKPRRYPEHLVRLGVEANALPPAKSGRAAADVHRHVEDLAGDYPDELALRLADLIMQPAQHAASRAGVVVLDETGADPRALELPFVPALEEEAARIAEHPRFEKQHFREAGRNDLHALRGLSRSSDNR